MSFLFSLEVLHVKYSLTDLFLSHYATSGVA